jgi:hypothetical protein
MAGDEAEQRHTRSALRALADEAEQAGKIVEGMRQWSLTPWTPQQARAREGMAEAIKTYARAVRDWDLLDRAVEQQISDQRNLVEWWDKHVQRRGSGKPGPQRGKRGRGKGKK